MHLQADYIVIGGGIAGLRALADLAGSGDVLLLTKSGPSESNTGYAQGGIAAAIGPDDSPDLHFADTIRAGAGLCDESAVEVLVNEGPRYVRQLIEWGVAFDRDARGEPALAREGAHAVRRVLHARDATGREIARALWARVSGNSRVRVLTNTLAEGVIVEGGECRGVRFTTEHGEQGVAYARAVLLATGGAGRVFRETTNPEIATGDGIAMAWRAGAPVGDLEFVQFHPTVLAVPGHPRFLLSEALRGEGAWLLNAGGERFMERYDPAGELAPRDVVATAMVQEEQRTGAPVYLSLAHLDPDDIRRHFPTIAEACARAGLDITRDRLPVSPAAHYMCGGVETDLAGRTGVPRLFAAGEVACTGVHGANRLASNSLLEGLVFGARAAAAMRQPVREAALRRSTMAREHDTFSAHPDPASVPVPELMWRRVGLLRTADGLGSAVAETGAISAALEARLAEGAPVFREASLALVGHLIARAAQRRHESRGGHRRADYPDRDDLHWKIHVAERRPSRSSMSKKVESTEAQVTEITPRSQDFSTWYTDVVRRAELADYSPVKGCMVIRPYGYAIWELIQRDLDARFKATGHVNAYFPLFVPEGLLMTEAEHVEGFAPQVAWVTQGGTEKLEERLAIRPTSEVIIGTMYAKWIQSWRDLPVLINQWANVVRWEKVTRPFLRTTEFLWQEGHTAHETEQEAEAETLKILALYKDFSETVLAMPVLDGPKSASEKFAGASRTYSIEALMGDGRALQAGTSHNLGQNFAKAFGIQFQGRDKQLQYAWTTSWGVSTRLVGGVIMTHGDDNGLVLPPRIAPTQVVIVPIPRGNWKETVLPKADAIKAELAAAGVRVHIDDREAYTPGWKYAEWELRGVPVRLEIGPKDIEKQQVVLVRRDTREKLPAAMSGLGDSVRAMLDAVQASLFERALKFREEHTSSTDSYDEFKSLMEGRPGFVNAPWCGEADCEAAIKADTQATIRNLPFENEASAKCVRCDRPAITRARFAKAY